MQGSRGEFADVDLLEPLVKQLGACATLRLFPEADHSFHVPTRTGRKDADVRAEMLEVLADWIDMIIIGRSHLEGPNDI